MARLRCLDLLGVAQHIIQSMSQTTLKQSAGKTLYLDALLIVLFALLLHYLVAGQYYLVYLFLAPVLYVISIRPMVRACVVATICGAVGSMIAFHWVYDYNQDIFSVVVAWIACAFCLFAVAVKLGQKPFKPSFHVFVPALIWCALMLVLSFTPLGGYWMELAIFQPTATPLISVVGGVGITFAILVINASVAQAAIKRQWRPMLLAISVLSLLVLPHLFGFIAEPLGERLKVALIQGQFQETWEWRQQNVHGQIFETYRDLTLEAAKDSPDIIVWPEYAIPVDIVSFNKPLRERVERLSQQIDTILILGSMFYDQATGDHQDVALVFRSGQLIDSYAAVRPVFFNENTVAAKNALHPIEVAGGFGISICFEDTQDYIFREYASQGAGFMVSLANNQDFGRGKILAELYSRLRAAENNRYIIRATNTGITSIVTPDGGVAADIPSGLRAVLTGEIISNSRPTYFTRYGYLPFCLLGGLIAVFGINITALTGKSG